MAFFKTIIPVSAFKKDTQQYLSLLQMAEEALMLTLHGRGAFVVMHVNSYMQFRELAQMGQHQGALDQALDHISER